MNAYNESKSAAARFLNEHEALQEAHETALLTIATQSAQLDANNVLIGLLEDRVKNAEASEATWLMHSVELSTHIRGLVDSSKRALMIADQVAQALADKMARTEPETRPETDGSEAIETALAEYSKRNTSEPLDLPPAAEWMSAATRSMLDAPAVLSN